ncbi:MAG: CGGC domain-containing protein [Thermodesulfobacteriota bacterium]
MARIGILTCSNCTQEANCASVVCLGDLRKRKGLFARYQDDEKLELIGIINCAGCPTLAAPEKILRRTNALTAYRLDALHFSYCMTALCPFLAKYEKIIREHNPGLTIVRGTHTPRDNEVFRQEMREILCPSLAAPQDMNDVIKGTFRTGP